MVFLLSALLGSLIPLSPRYLPESRGDVSNQVDWFGGVTIDAIFGMLLAVAGIQRGDATSTLVMASIVVAGWESA